MARALLGRIAAVLVSVLASAAGSGCASPAAPPPLPAGDPAPPAGTALLDAGFDLPGVEAALARALDAGPGDPSAVPAAAGTTDPVNAMTGFDIWVPRFKGHLTLDGIRGDVDGTPWGGGFGFWGELRPGPAVIWFDLQSTLIADDLGFEAWDPWFGSGDLDHYFTFMEAAAGPTILDIPAGPPEGGALPGDGEASYADPSAPAAPAAPGTRPIGPSRFRLDALAGLRINWYSYYTEFDYYYDDIYSDPEYRIWGDPIVGARMEWRPLPWLALRLRGDVGGFDVGSHLAWRAMATLTARVGKGTWLTLGWNEYRLDYERGDNGNFGIDARIGGPFAGFDFWF